MCSLTRHKRHEKFVLNQYLKLALCGHYTCYILNTQYCTNQGLSQPYAMAPPIYKNTPLDLLIMLIDIYTTIARIYYTHDTHLCTRLIPKFVEVCYLPTSLNCFLVHNKITVKELNACLDWLGFSCYFNCVNMYWYYDIMI